MMWQMWQRMLGAGAMLALFLGAILIAPLRHLLFPAVVAGFGAVTLYEVVQLLRAKGLRVSLLASALAFLALLADGLWTGFRFGLPIILLTFLALLTDRVARQDFQNIAADVGGTLLAVLYVGAAGAMILALMAHPIPSGRMMGVQHVVFLIAVVFTGDSAAYLVGSRFGRHPFFPILSPKKSIEGAVASVVVSVAAGLVCLLVSPTLRQVYGFGHGMVLSLILGLGAPIGDLAESALKRDAGAKDSSKLIAGHGGFLDVFDSLLFCVPLQFVYLKMLLGP
jgi:phosphatidate cytidylyltransferase